MKFFKHFTDAHRGKSMQALLRRWDKDRGMKAIGMYWTLVELCAEKLEKAADEEFTDAHCRFEFDLRYIRDTLQTHQTATLLMYLRCFDDVGLMSVTCSDDVVTIHMPKLLECMDRDAKRARTERAPSAPKKKIKKEDKEYIFRDQFDRLAKKYISLFPGTGEGPALARFKKQMPDLTAIAELDQSMDHYRAYLDSEPWRAAKTTFANYLGTERSSFFWRDYRAPVKLKAVPGESTGGWEDGL